jgi:hypothetical protein
MKVLICGGRDFADYDYLKTVLSALQVTREPFTAIIHGCARGADTLAGQYADRHNIQVAPFPADWQKHGRSAGPIRNKRMLVDGKPDLVVAFPGGRGTANMIQQAKAAGVEVIDARRS